MNVSIQGVFQFNPLLRSTASRACEDEYLNRDKSNTLFEAIGTVCRNISERSEMPAGALHRTKTSPVSDTTHESEEESELPSQAQKWNCTSEGNIGGLNKCIFDSVFPASEMMSSIESIDNSSRTQPLLDSRDKTSHIFGLTTGTLREALFPCYKKRL